MKNIRQNTIPANADDALRILRAVPDSSQVSQSVYNGCLVYLEAEINSLRSQVAQHVSSKDVTKWTN